MARRIPLVTAAVLTLLLSGTGARAAPPKHFTFDFDFTVPRPILSAICGVPVFVHIEGAVRVTLFQDQSGSVIRELDVATGGVHFTFFSPLEAGGTGKSVTVSQYGRIMYTYPEGTDIGDPVILSTVGTTKSPGEGATTAGRQVAEGIVVGYSPEGIPAVAPVEIVSESGIFPDPLSVIADRCAILADP
jgi:hypothetical protein